ncbi:unnamed protein product [Linum trigynum]|uniref:Uncharacterized protein n=1 Tax=Linum trigynum TaxID=586398 RepID=A0AAV2C814_9ROSI
MNPAAFLTFLLMITLSPVLTAAGRPPLRDTHGNLVESGRQYLIVPATYYGGGGGGLTLAAGAPTNNNHTHASCHVSIIQANNPTSHGLPVTFTPRDNKQYRPVTIFGAMDLNIQFAASSACARSTVWKVSGSHQRFVSVGGEKEIDHHRSSASNWFKIFRVKQQHNNHGGKAPPVLFKIVACSSACKDCHVSCKDVGVVVDAKTGARRLALANHGPLLVQFKKV